MVNFAYTKEQKHGILIRKNAKLNPKSKFSSAPMVPNHYTITFSTGDPIQALASEPVIGIHNVT